MVGFPVACNLASVMNSFLGLSVLCFFFSLGKRGFWHFLDINQEEQHLKKDKNNY